MTAGEELTLGAAVPSTDHLEITVEGNFERAVEYTFSRSELKITVPTNIAGNYTLNVTLTDT